MNDYFTLLLSSTGHCVLLPSILSTFTTRQLPGSGWHWLYHLETVSCSSTPNQSQSVIQEGADDQFRLINKGFYLWGFFILLREQWRANCHSPSGWDRIQVSSWNCCSHLSQGRKLALGLCWHHRCQIERWEKKEILNNIVECMSSDSHKKKKIGIWPGADLDLEWLEAYTILRFLFMKMNIRLQMQN